MPCDYSKYPPDWQQRRARILKRAQHRCEWCGVKNHAVGYRIDGEFISVKQAVDILQETGQDVFEDIPIDQKPVRIVLTIAHLDHDKENWDVSDDRLKAGCQHCHLNYDRDHHQRNAAITRRKKKRNYELFEELS